MTVRKLQVSQATARIVRQGHPWVLPDRDTGSMRHLTTGQLVELVTRDGKGVGLALASPDQRVVARVVGPPGGHFDPLERLDRALQRRADLLGAADTDVYRLVHGEADGLPGLFVDRYGPALVVIRQSLCLAPWLPAIYDELLGRTGLDLLWEKDHLADLRRSGVTGRVVRGSAPDELVVHERGLRFGVSPFGGLATGLYPDQRPNRDELSRRGPFPRVLNLFAYTGAFSVSALADGSRRAVDVDLSKASLKRARANVALNDLDSSAHRTVHRDAVKYCAGLADDSFDLVVVDPPASARGGGGWSAHKGYGPLLDQVLRILAPGGTLLACLNLRSARGTRLRQLVKQRANAAGRPPAQLQAAPPGPDFPSSRGFDESRSFQGVLVSFDD
jgi:23S rRNA (cytosine1962-C5)-methyltransferase